MHSNILIEDTFSIGKIVRYMKADLDQHNYIQRNVCNSFDLRVFCTA